MHRVYYSFRSRGFLDHMRISKDEAPEIMVNYLGVDPAETNEELDRTMRLMLGLNI